MNDIAKKEWEPKYSVDIESIDNHQKKMFELFNRLIDLKESGSEAKECIQVISAINEQGKLYFSEEERLLRQNKYPDFGAHSKLHRQFIKDSISLRREISDDLDNLTGDVINSLRDWLIHHILSMDSLYVPFLRIDRYIKEKK